MSMSYRPNRLQIALILVFVLVGATYGMGQDGGGVNFDPFASGISDLQVKTDPAQDQGQMITRIGFENADISMILQIISDTTGWSIFPTAEVCRAKVSLWAKNISALQVLDAVVTMGGFTYSREGDIVTVMTYDEYAQHHGLSKQVITLEYADVVSVSLVVKPFLSKVGKSVVHEDTNALVLLDTDACLKSIVDVIAKLDVPDQAQENLEVVDLQYADAESLAETLQKMFSQPERLSSGMKTVAAGDSSANVPEGRITPAKESPVAAAVSSPQSTVAIYALGRSNQLIVKAFQEDIDRLKSLVEKLDVYVEPTSKTYHFTYVDAAEIYPGLESILDLSSRSQRSRGTSDGQRRRDDSRISGLTLVEKSNSILLTGPPSTHRIMASIVASVDVPATYEAGMIRIYKLNNADVEEVASVVSSLLEGEKQADEGPGEPTFASEVTSKATWGEGTDLTETEAFRPEVEPRVAVSKATNSVIVLATARQHRELEQLVEELDRRRRQVLIESKIVEVTTAEGLELGVELSGAGGEGYAFTQFGLSSNLDPTTGMRDIIVSPGGSASVMAWNEVQAIFRALESTENAKVASAPRILVNDNCVGSISGVAEEPYTQINQGEVTDTVSFAGFVEAGTQFTVTPHISENDCLRVEYQITLNSFGAESSDASIPPPRKTSTIQSEATVANGQTIIVGGMQMSDELTTVEKVPLLGDVPLLGLLFRNTSVSRTYKTIYLFITPVIMDQEDFSDLKEVSDQAVEEAEMNTSGTMSRSPCPDTDR